MHCQDRPLQLAQPGPTSHQNTFARMPWLWVRVSPPDLHCGQACSATRIVTQHNATQHCNVQHSTAQPATAKNCTEVHDAQPDNVTAQHATRHDTTRHDTTRHNTTQHNTTQHNTIRHDTTQYKKNMIHKLQLSKAGRLQLQATLADTNPGPCVEQCSDHARRRTVIHEVMHEYGPENSNIKNHQGKDVEVWYGVEEFVSTRGLVQFSSGPQPPQRGQGVQSWVQVFSALRGVFLNSLFH